MIIESEKQKVTLVLKSHKRNSEIQSTMLHGKKLLVSDYDKIKRLKYRQKINKSQITLPKSELLQNPLSSQVSLIIKKMLQNNIKMQNKFQELPKIKKQQNQPFLQRRSKILARNPSTNIGKFNNLIEQLRFQRKSQLELDKTLQQINKSRQQSPFVDKIKQEEAKYRRNWFFNRYKSQTSLKKKLNPSLLTTIQTERTIQSSLSRYENSKINRLDTSLSRNMLKRSQKFVTIN